jgi:hypothetical protein
MSHVGHADHQPGKRKSSHDLFEMSELEMLQFQTKTARIALTDDTTHALPSFAAPGISSHRADATDHQHPLSRRLTASS